MNLCYNPLICISGVYFTGFHGIPYGHVHPSVPAAAHGGMNYGPNATGRKYQNNKVHPTLKCLKLNTDWWLLMFFTVYRSILAISF